MNSFSLIETMRWEPDIGFTRLSLHLARLERSARYVGFPEPRFADRKLAEEVAGAATPRRVRLSFDASGRIDVTSTPFIPVAPDTAWRVRIASQRLDPSDRLLRVKSTRRQVYDEARAEYSASEADEVLLLNQQGEVCEGTITSIFLDDGSGLLRTPPIACGLLAGVLRAELICQGKARVGRISRADMETGKLFVGNSLRGLIAASQ